MKYYNQRRYPHIPYPQFMAFPDDPRCKEETVSDGGCGLCSACMVVDHLTMKTLSVRECARLSMEHLANHGDGTDMTVLGPVIAEKYGLEYAASDDIKAAMETVRDGGRVIALVKGSTPERRGIFSNGGHFVLIISAAEDEICILDPNWSEKKYAAAAEAGLIRMDGCFLYAPGELLHRETMVPNPDYLDKPGYYLFRRRSRCESER